jgi:hypothetical protein
MARWLFAALLLLAGFDAAACPLCLGSFQSSPAQQLVDLRQAVLAVPTTDGSRYRVVEVIKGERPPNSTIEAGRSRSDAGSEAGAPKSGKPLLLVHDNAWPMWIIVGAIGAEHASWLRKLAAGKRPAETNAEEWRARVALILPYLENPEPLVAEIAYGELASAPYAALRTEKPRLAAPAVRRWLADSKLAARQPLYLLLMGFAGDAQDAAALEERLEAAWRAGDATNLGSMLAADLELRGAARMTWIDAKYLRDRGRSPPEIKAALLALSVHGNANGAIPRERVIQSYRMFMKEHKEIAGYVAQDLAAWQYWDAVPEFAALMKSDLRQQYPSRLAIIEYLRQSPRAEAHGGERQTSVEPGPGR